MINEKFYQFLKKSDSLFFQLSWSLSHKLMGQEITYQDLLFLGL